MGTAISTLPGTAGLGRPDLSLLYAADEIETRGLLIAWLDFVLEDKGGLGRRESSRPLLDPSCERKPRP